MPKHPLYPAVFLAGLLTLAWIGAGYLGNPLALGVVLLIAACYLAGAWELHRYRHATATLVQAMDAAAQPVDDLPAWLEPLPSGLRDAVRQRVEGGRVPLPAPSLTPYLVGLLVLLGMLGTLLGMMNTLRGTGLALESASDLSALRASIAAPVQGLAFAFGTSIAGVAGSAMLGLLAALCRHERVQAAHGLDAAIATTLRRHSRQHQRDEAFQLLQRQSDAMPTLVAQLQATMATIEQQALTDSERQAAQQTAFHDRSEAVYAKLAASVQQSLQESAVESARATGAALQPVMAATMDAIARNAAALHGEVMQAVQQQVAELTSGFQATTTTVAGLWTGALDKQQQAHDAQVQQLGAALARFHDTFAQRSADVVEGLSARFEATGTAMAARNQIALEAAAGTFESHAAALTLTVQQSHAQLHATLEDQAQARMAVSAAALDAMADTLATRWDQAGEAAAARQQALLDTLGRTADAITTQTQAHARDTIAEISQLVQAASEAPKAAAEVIGELRQKLSDSMARDTAMLEERGRLLSTVETLLDAVNHASSEQRTSVDALISTTADLLDRVGTRFTAHIEAETGKLDAAATRIAAGAIDVASLGDAFGAAVQRFGESNEQLVERLQAIETALEQSLSRSDEQLAYYVAQAREVVDLSVLAQKQIIGELQQLTGTRTGAVAA